MLNLIEHVTQERWIIGLRADSSLLFFSAKAAGYRQHIGPEWGGRFAETMLVPINEGRLIRIINLRQAKEFHGVSHRLMHENPQRLTDVIDDSDRLYLEIDRVGEEMTRKIETGELTDAKEDGLRLLNLYERTAAQFITAFSLGKELTEIGPTNEAGREALRRHDDWRNSMALKEERLGERLFRLIEILARRDKTTTDPAELIRNLTISELSDWLAGNLTSSEIEQLVQPRLGKKFSFVDLDERPQTVITDPETVRRLQEHFSQPAEPNKTEPKRTLTGQLAYDPDKPISGLALVIRTKNELEEKGPQVNGKIVVAEQTTPHYLPYLKGALGIVTDEGGLTCHAAIVAREMRLPCLTGTGTATRNIADGDLIELRPDRKEVRIIERSTDRQA